MLQEANIKRYSVLKDEDERLFPPYSFFRIKKVKFNDGKSNLKNEGIYNGTYEHPFKIELEIIQRDFYLDKAKIDNEEFLYNKSENIWITKTTL